MSKRSPSRREPAETNGNSHAKMTTDDWASAITASWQKAVESIIQTGKLLIEAKAALRAEVGYGSWGEIVEKLPFSWRTADYLMAIAEHPVLSDSQFIANLPPSWGTLADLCALPDNAIKEMIADGRISAGMTRADAAEIIKEVRDGGLYDYERIREAARVLIKFMTKWPEPGTIAERAFDGMVEEGHELNLDEVIKAAAWLGSLGSACRALDREENKALLIGLERTTEAEPKKARKPGPSNQRAKFTVGRVCSPTHDEERPANG